MTIKRASEFGEQEKARLLRDVGRSISLKTGADGGEADLMRAAHDPLLVRRLMLERQGSHDERGRLAGLKRISLVPVTLRTGQQGESKPIAVAPAASRYEAPGGRLEPSLSPTVFAPAAEDRDAALDLHVTLPPRSRNGGFGLRLIWLGLGGVLLLGINLLPD